MFLAVRVEFIFPLAVFVHEKMEQGQPDLEDKSAGLTSTREDFTGGTQASRTCPSVFVSCSRSPCEI